MFKGGEWAQECSRLEREVLRKIEWDRRYYRIIKKIGGK